MSTGSLSACLPVQEQLSALSLQSVLHSQPVLSEREWIPLAERVVRDEELYASWTVCKTVFVCIYYLLKAALGQTQDLSDWWYHKENIEGVTNRVIHHYLDHPDVQTHEKLLPLLQLTLTGKAYLEMQEKQGTANCLDHPPIPQPIQPRHCHRPVPRPSLLQNRFFTDRAESSSTAISKRALTVEEEWTNILAQRLVEESGKVLDQCLGLHRRMMQIMRECYDTHHASGEEQVDVGLLNRMTDVKETLDQCYKAIYEIDTDAAMDVKRDLDLCNRWLTELLQTAPEDCATKMDLYNLRRVICEKPIEDYYTDEKHGETYVQPDHTKMRFGWDVVHRGDYARSLGRELKARVYHPKFVTLRNCDIVTLEKQSNQVEYEETGKVGGWFFRERREGELIARIAKQREEMQVTAEKLKGKLGKWKYESAVICTELDLQYMNRPRNIKWQSIVLFHELVAEEVEVTPAVESSDEEASAVIPSCLKKAQEKLQAAYRGFYRTEEAGLLEIEFTRAREAYLELYALWQEPAYQEDRKKAHELYRLLKPYEVWLLEHQTRSATDVV